MSSTLSFLSYCVTTYLYVRSECARSLSGTQSGVERVVYSCYRKQNGPLFYSASTPLTVISSCLGLRRSLQILLYRHLQAHRVVAVVVNHLQAALFLLHSVHVRFSGFSGITTQYSCQPSGVSVESPNIKLSLTSSNQRLHFSPFLVFHS